MTGLARIVQVRQACVGGEARRIRLAAGVSQSELAAAVRVDHTTVARWEAGERLPRASAALRYSEVLGELERAVRVPLTA